MYLGAKYLVFVSARSLKPRELSFSQFVYFWLKVCLFFNFWMIKFTIMELILQTDFFFLYLETYETNARG